MNLSQSTSQLSPTWCGSITNKPIIIILQNINFCGKKMSFLVYLNTFTGYCIEMKYVPVKYK